MKLWRAFDTQWVSDRGLGQNQTSKYRDGSSSGGLEQNVGPSKNEPGAGRAMVFFTSVIRTALRRALRGAESKKMTHKQGPRNHTSC